MAKDDVFTAKFFTPRVMTRALTLLDKSTAIVVGTAWLVALFTLIIALIALHGASSARHDALNAVEAEPILPTMTTTPIAPREGQAILDRLQRQYPDLKFDLNGQQELSIKSMDGNKFHEWVTALSYVDAMAPQFRWSLTNFCVGHCGQELMSATVTGQRVLFTPPPAE